MVDAVLDRTDLTKTFLWRADLRRARVRDARMDAAGLDETLVVDADFTGTIGTVSPGGTVVVEAGGPPVDAVPALNAAGARVSEYEPKRE